jgi:hypothetical protein
MTKRKFQWDDDTMNYLTNLEELNGMSHVSKRVLEFVVNDCTLEDGETIQDLFNDIMDKVEDNLQTKYDD